MLGYHLSSVFKQYLAEDVNININMVTSSEQVYPAVTICNANPARASQLRKARGEYPVLNYLFTEDDNGHRRKRSFQKSEEPLVDDKQAVDGQEHDLEMPSQVEKIFSDDGKWLPVSGNVSRHQTHMAYWSDIIREKNISTKKKQKKSPADVYGDTSIDLAKRPRVRRDVNNPCSSNSDCNNGLCIQAKCVCPFFWYGTSCSNHAEACEKSQPVLSQGVAINKTVVLAAIVIMHLQCSYGYNYNTGNLIWNCTNKKWNQEPVQCLEQTGMSNSFQMTDRFTTTLAQLPDNVRMQLGYQAEDMLFDCQYNGYKCDVNNDFARFLNPYHGNCYTFNSKDNNMTLRNTTHTGRRYGLHLSINVGQHEYMDISSNLAGVVVLVHSQDVIPFPEDDGVFLIPGEFSLIGLKMLKITRQPDPYSDCVEQVDTSNVSGYDEFHSSVGYSVRRCQKMCVQNQIIANCDCASPYYSKPKDIPDNVTLCQTWINETNACVNNVQDSLVSGICECHNPCEENIHEMLLSQAAWPITVNQMAMISELKQHFPQVFTGSKDSDATIMARNFLKLSLYFEQLNYQLISETPTYTKPKFFADIGSCLGLWMGISAVTIVEFLEFILHVVTMATVGKGCCKKNKVESQHLKKRGASNVGNGQNQPITSPRIDI